MNLLDIILIGFAALGLLMGLFRNWRRMFIGFAVLGLAMRFYIKGGPLDYISNWIRYDSIHFLVQQNWIQPINIDLQEQLGITLRIETVQEAFLLIQNLDISGDQIIQNVDLFCKCMGITAGLIVIGIASMIVSSILYWALLRWILPKKLRKGFIGRGIGGVVGILCYSALGVILISSVSSYAYGLNGNVIVPLTDASSDLYKSVANLIGNEQLNSISETINTIAKYSTKIDPYAKDSMLCRPIFETLDSMGFSPFNIISTTSVVTGEEITFRNAFDNFLNGVTSKFIEKSGSFAGV